MTNALILQGDALSLPLPDDSVDLIVTSPPYFALRSYTDQGEHYEGQIGSEATPAEFIAALIAATAEMKRVIKPTGSIFINLGDKYAGSGGHNNSNIGASKDRAPSRYNQSTQVGPLPDMKQGARDGHRRSRPAAVPGIRPKSLMGLPWRYAIRCIDELDLILREEITWEKVNSTPESAQDRCRHNTESWFHFVKEPKYFCDISKLRVPQKSVSKSKGKSFKSRSSTDRNSHRVLGFQNDAPNPLGKLPGSVWTVPSDPLRIPKELGFKHFAAFPREFPRRIILGWSPKDVCLECGQGRKPIIDRRFDGEYNTSEASKQRERSVLTGGIDKVTLGRTNKISHIVTGYEYNCDNTDSPVRPGIVLDPFSGTGTTVLVARALGRVGIGVDLSHEYCRLARWRVFESGHDQKIIDRTNEENQGRLDSG